MPTPQSIEPDERLARAEALLREAVYRSRALQAATSSLGAMAPTPASAPDGADATRGRCGLGERAAVSLDLSDEGRRLFSSLWPVEPDATEMQRIRAALADWVVEQDGRDRKRNHYLKAFRQAHGFDRTLYTAAQTAEFEAGLARINADEDVARRAAATRLIGG